MYSQEPQFAALGAFKRNHDTGKQRENTLILIVNESDYQPLKMLSQSYLVHNSSRNPTFVLILIQSFSVRSTLSAPPFRRHSQSVSFEAQICGFGSLAGRPGKLDGRRPLLGSEQA